MPKLTDLINNNAQLTFSFEVTPDLQFGKLDNLIVEPIFYSITWHAKAHQNKDLDIGPLKLAKHLRSKDKEVMIHLSCDLLKKEFLIEVLELLQNNNIRNLFVVLGESFEPASSDFKTSEHLIKAIREESGDYFCIGVAGTPDCNDDRLQQLKQKVQSGADYILTQAFFDPSVYSTFSTRCKTVGINVPVIPGIFPFETYQQLSKFINMCKIKVSDNILEYIKDKNESEGISGKVITQKLIESIAAETDMKHFHLFTLNKLAQSASIVKPLL